MLRNNVEFKARDVMRKLILFFVLLACSMQLMAQKWVRVNSVGYLPADVKVAVFISTENAPAEQFNVCDAVTGKVVYTGAVKAVSGKKWGMQSAYRLNFSDVKGEGGYYIECAGAKSPNFRIGADVYDGLACSGDTLNAFEIMDSEGNWYSATAQITNKNTVDVTDGEHTPVAVRCGFKPYPDPMMNLYNSAGLIVTPFRIGEYE